jgi:hypothetical protein
MTEQQSPARTTRRARVRATFTLAIVSLAAMTALAPSVMAQGTTVVTAIPSDGWFRSPDNTAGGSVELVEGPGPGTLGTGSLALTVAANTDFAGVAFPFLPLGVPFSDLTGGAWRTFVTGATGVPEEAAALKLPAFQTGISAFTTVVVEVMRNGTVTPNIWQETILDDSAIVWQTNTGDGFCIQSDPCEFGEFKGNYPNGRFTAAQIAIGTGVPAVTSYADGVVLTIDGVTDTFDFDVAAAPTPTPTAAPPNPAPATSTPTAAGLPNTSTDARSAEGNSSLGLALGSVVLLSAVTVAILRSRRLSR